MGTTCLGYRGVGLDANRRALAAGAGEYVDKGSIRAGLAKAARRALGQGPFVEALAGRAKTAAGVARANALGLGLSAAATAVWLASGERMDEIKAMLMHRYQSGDMTSEQYQKVFSDRPHPDSVDRYWEV